MAKVNLLVDPLGRIFTTPGGSVVGADTTPPVTVLSNIPANRTMEISTNITVGGEDVVAYKYKLDAGVFSASFPNTTPLALGSLPEGEHTLYVVGKDLAGNWQTEETATTCTWIVDLTPPVVVLSNTPADQTTATTATISVGGNDVVSYRYKMDAGEYSVETASTEPIQLSGLAIGSHTLSVIGKDMAGNWKPTSESTNYTWTIAAQIPTTPYTIRESGNAIYAMEFSPDETYPNKVVFATTTGIAATNDDFATQRTVLSYAGTSGMMNKLASGTLIFGRGNQATTYISTNKGENWTKTTGSQPANNAFAKCTIENAGYILYGGYSNQGAAGDWYATVARAAIGTVAFSNTNYSWESYNKPEFFWGTPAITASGAVVMCEGYRDPTYGGNMRWTKSTNNFSSIAATATLPMQSTYCYSGFFNFKGQTYLHAPDGYCYLWNDTNNTLTKTSLPFIKTKSECVMNTGNYMIMVGDRLNNGTVKVAITSNCTSWDQEITLTGATFSTLTSACVNNTGTTVYISFSNGKVLKVV